MRPVRKRKLVDEVRSEWGVSIRRACRVVLIDTPAAERGPDLEMFAALAKGALLVVRPGEDSARLAWLRQRLTRCAAVPVVTVFNHASTVFHHR